MTKIANKFIVIFLLFCLLLSFATAELSVIKIPYEQPDFSVSSFSSSSSCACSSTIDYVIITNPLSFSQAFTLSTNDDFLSISSSSIVVGPLSSLSVPYKINTPCNAHTTSYEIIIKGSSETKSIAKDLMILSCQNLKITTSPQNISAQICEPFENSFIIENPGDFSEEYQIDAQSYKQFTPSFSQKITLAPKTSSTVQFPYLFTCDMVGDYSLKYKLKSINSRRVAYVSQTVNVANTYNYSIFIDPINNICLNGKKAFKITIENKNNFTDFFKVAVDVPSFVEVKFPEFEGKITKTIVLPPFTKTSFEVIISPFEKKQIGIHSVSLTVQSKFAQTTQKATRNFSIDNCYDFSSLFPSKVSDVSLCENDSFTKEILLNHRGINSPDLKLKSSSPFVRFENNSVNFSGWESKNVSLIFDTPSNTTSKEVVTLSALFKNKTVDDISFKFNLNTNKGCYNIIPLKKSLSIFENAQDMFIPFQNIGIRNSVFSVSVLDAPEFVMSSQRSLNLTAEDSSSLYFNINKTQLVKFANFFNNGSIIGLNFSLTLALISQDSDMSYNYIIDLNIVENPWYINFWNYFSSLNSCFIIFFILSFLVILFGIVGIIKTARHDHFYSNNILALILVLVFVITTSVVLFYFGTPQTPYTTYNLSTNSTTHIRMLEDSSKTIDLNSFFFDPDDNIVDFGVGLKNNSFLNESLNDSILTLTPQKNWFGNDSMVLFAIDAYNESALSPKIIVEVFPIEDYSFFELFSLFCEYAVLVVLFILFLVIYIAFSFHARPKEKQLTIDEAQDRNIIKIPHPSKKQTSKKSKGKTKTDKPSKTKISSKKTKKKFISKKSLNKNVSKFTSKHK